MTDWPEAREGWRDSFPPTIALADLYLRLYGGPDEVIATSHCDLSLRPHTCDQAA